MSRNLIGVTLGKYRCDEFIGLGGMAEVYRAVDTELEREVALKVLHPFFVSEDGFVERFRREARTLAALKHPNIVEIFDSGLQDFNSYVVMEYVPGPTLKDRIRELNARDERMSLPEVRRILDALFAALRYAHRANVVHRDLKPTNVILADDGRVVLTDFGLAKIIGSTIHTASMSMIGTPAYMAPEQAQTGSVDLRSDIYSLGVILFELLTGRLPFIADTPFAMITKHTQETLPSVVALRRDLPRGLDGVLRKAAAKDPAERFQSVDQFADALNAVLDGRRVPFLASRPRLPRRARVWIALAGIVAIALVGIGSVQGWFAAPPPAALPSPSMTPSATATPRILLAETIGQTDLYERPEIDSPIVGQLADGVKVELLARQGVWWQVRVMDDSQLIGWVLTLNLDFIPTPTPLPTLTNTPPPGASLTPTPLPTATTAPQPTATPTPTPTPSPVAGLPFTSTPGGGQATATPSKTVTPSPTGTLTTTSTPTPTRTPTPTSTVTGTMSPTPTDTPTPTPSSTPPRNFTPVTRSAPGG